MLSLKPLSLSDGEPVYQMLQGIGKNENGFHNDVKGMTYAEYLAWLQREYGYDHGVHMPDWMVPQTSYWLMDGETPVGCGRLRHELNDALRETGGHIGYAIALPYRGRGYGNQVLALLIDEARKLGIRRLQLSAQADNAPSNKVIRANGGVLFRECDGRYIYRIDVFRWIARCGQGFLNFVKIPPDVLTPGGKLCLQKLF